MYELKLIGKPTKTFDRSVDLFRYARQQRRSWRFELKEKKEKKKERYDTK